MSSNKQGLFGLNTIIPFGKYKGRSVSSVYCGDATSIVYWFKELMCDSLSLILSEKFYGNSTTDNVARLSSGWDGDINRINQTELRYFVSSLKSGAVCNYKVSGNAISVTVQKPDNKRDAELSIIGCKIAKEYVTRFFGKIDLSNHGNVEFFRPALLAFSPQLSTDEKELAKVEGNPNYIHWCINAVDGFCLEGNQDGIHGLNDLPVFSLDSFWIKAGKIKDDFTFEIGIRFEADFIEAEEHIVKANCDKYRDYIGKKNTPYYPEEVFHDEINDYQDNSDDEENIMRGLDSGNGDQFGF